METNTLQVEWYIKLLVYTFRYFPLLGQGRVITFYVDFLTEVRNSLIRQQELLWWLSGKDLPANAGDVGSVQESKRSFQGGNDNPL